MMKNEKGGNKHLGFAGDAEIQKTITADQFRPKLTQPMRVPSNLDHIFPGQNHQTKSGGVKSRSGDRV